MLFRGSRLDRIRHVDEAMLEAELAREMHAECLHAIALGRVMACGDEGDPRLPRNVHRLFGGLACKKHIHTERDRRFDVALRRSRAPRGAPHEARLVSDHEWFALETRFDALRELAQRKRRIDLAVVTDVLLSELPVNVKAEMRGERGVVAHDGMRVERQMERKEI